VHELSHLPRVEGGKKQGVQARQRVQARQQQLTNSGSNAEEEESEEEGGDEDEEEWMPESDEDEDEEAAAAGLAAALAAEGEQEEQEEQEQEEQEQEEQEQGGPSLKRPRVASPDAAADGTPPLTGSALGAQRRWKTQEKKKSALPDDDDPFKYPPLRGCTRWGCWGFPSHAACGLQLWAPRSVCVRTAAPQPASHR